MNHATLSAALAAAVLAGCSGSSIPATTTSGSAPSSGDTPVTFVVLIPASPTADARSVRRRSRYISPSTQSIGVTLGGRTLLVANVGAGSKACKAGSGHSRTCRAGAMVPSGAQSFDITAYDGTGGLGNILATGSVPATLQPNSAQSVRVSLTGKPASVAVSLKSPYPPAGKPAATAVTVSALDADGNTILGTYASHISIKDLDPSGATKLSASSISDSSNAVTLSYDGSSVYRAVVTAALPGLGKARAIFAPFPRNIAQYVAPWVRTPYGLQPMGLTDVCLGPDGNMWVTGGSWGSIEKVDSSGKLTTYPLGGTTPVGIVVGPDKNLWFAENQIGKIGKITTGGTITSYALPVPQGGSSQPSDTAVGPDGNVWWVDQGIGAPGVVGFGKITTSGKITKYALPASSVPQSITAGPDGNLWITDTGQSAILVASTSGKIIATHRLPTRGAAPWGITVGPDKNLWFAEYVGNKIGRMTLSGQLKEVPVPSAQSGPLDVAPGPDGNVWFTESGGGIWNEGGRVGYVTPDMTTIREFAGTTMTHVHDLAFDANDNLWYTSFEQSFSNVSKLAY